MEKHVTRSARCPQIRPATMPEISLSKNTDTRSKALLLSCKGHYGCGCGRGIGDGGKGTSMNGSHLRAGSLIRQGGWS